jgi:glycosyltransferase involved in cell wall biosynthesis
MRVMIASVARFTQPSGICRYAANLALCLSQQPAVTSVSLAVGAWQETYFRDLLGAGAKLDLIPIQIGSGSRGRNWWYWNDLPQLASKLNCDVMHCSYPVPVRHAGFAGRTVVTVHDMYAFDFPENFGFPAVLFNRAFFRQALRASDGVVCDSRETLERLVHHFPRFTQKKKASVVPCSMDFDRAKTRQPASLSWSMTSPFVLCVAQHRKNKNIDLVIKSFAALKSSDQKLADFRLLIVGGVGPETAGLHQLAASLLPDKSVVFTSGLASEELAWLYEHCSLLAIPSSQEGFCYPLVEGMYFGARIVCSDIPILREIGSPACLYFDLEAAPQALTDAMRRGLAAPQPDYGTTIERYSHGSVSKQQMEFYQELGSKPTR